MDFGLQAKNTGFTSFHRHLAVAAALIVLVGGWAAWRIWEERRGALAAAADLTDSQARNGAERIDAWLKGVDLLLTDVAQRAADERDAERLTIYLLDRSAAYPEINNSFVTDAAGLVLHSTLSVAKGARIGDRPYFREAQSQHADEAHLVVSNPTPSRTRPGATSVLAVRPIHGADGRFLGIAAASLDGAFFSDLLDSLLPADKAQGGAKLAKNTGVMLASAPLRLGAWDPDNEPSGTALAQHLALSVPGSRHVGVPFFNDSPEPFVSAVRSLPRYPLAVAVGVRLDATLADWRESVLLQLSALSVAAAAALSLAVFLDRSERERIEERARYEAHMKLAAGVFDNTSEGILVTDRDGVIVSVNPAFTRITGYAREEAIGARPNLLKSNRHDRAFYQNMWEDLTKIGSWNGEVWNRRKNGDLFLQQESINTLYDADGETVGYLAVFTDVTEQRRKDERIRHLAYHDVLTGLANRQLVIDRMDHAVALAAREGGMVAVMFIDLDRFKLVNDTLGHNVGDELLCEAARRVRAVVRRADTVGRLGGDEFVVVAERLNGPDDAAVVAEKICGALREPYNLEDHVLHVGGSLGVAVYPQDGEDAAELMRKADTAMYAAKADGGGGFRFFTEKMTETTRYRLRLEREIREALLAGGFELHYQPQIDLSSGAVAGFEALIRWRRDDGYLPPDQFIPLAEETGLIRELGDWVLREACRQAAAWRAAGWRDGHIAVNVSPHQLTTGGFATRLAEHMQITGAAPADLQIEITESALLADPDAAARELAAARKLGVLIAIDDFGVGYSSLRHLVSLPVDAIKIDKSFVRDISAYADRFEIVKAIVALAEALGMAVVAEGVETQAELDSLKSCGCRLAQGFLFARPAPADEALAALAHVYRDKAG